MFASLDEKNKAFVCVWSTHHHEQEVGEYMVPKDDG